MEHSPTALLRSTLTGRHAPLEAIEEFTETGESFEVEVSGLGSARLRSEDNLWQRFAAFFPFLHFSPGLSLREGGTPLIDAGSRLQSWTGIPHLFLKDETRNPTGSFKDRGSFACITFSHMLGERVAATVSTGNMGHSLAAYGARAGIPVLVFVPSSTPREKLFAMALHGATIIRVHAPDYSDMKHEVLRVGAEQRLRIVSGNGPIRTEGYKCTAFELFEQMGGDVPEVIAVPTSACGHIRGIFKGYRELREAGLIQRLPRMAVVQAARNNPIVAGIKQGRDTICPVAHVDTIAEAITSGNPAGGDEIVQKARLYDWPAEDVEEEEILEGQRLLAGSGFFVEPSAAITLPAVRKLRAAGAIAATDRVVLMLTGGGLKDGAVLARQPLSIIDTPVGDLHETLASLLPRT